MARTLTQSQLARTQNCCAWCNKQIFNFHYTSLYKTDALKRAEVEHYEWIANYIEQNVPGEISVVHSILEYLFPVVYGGGFSRPFLLQTPVKKYYHVQCLSITCSTKSGRRSKAPKRFEDLAFVKGSGVSGCDRFESGYDSGAFYDNEKYFSDLKRKPDSDFIVGDDFDEVESLPSDEVQSLPSDEEECDYGSSSEEEEWESDYDSDE